MVPTSAAFATLAILLLPLSGCIEGAQPVSSVPSETIPEGAGAIEGHVVDSALVPIAGAQVGIIALGLVVDTKQDGSFRFGSLAPGRHELAAQKLGYSSAAASI